MRTSWTGRRRQRPSPARSLRAAPGRRSERPRVVNGRTPDDARSAADRKARVAASGAAETPAPLVAAGQGNAGAGPLAQVGRQDGGRFQPEGRADSRQGREVRGNRQAEAAEPAQAAPLRRMRHGVPAAQPALRLLLQAMRRPGPERKDPAGRNDPARLRTALRREILLGHCGHAGHRAGGVPALPPDTGAALRQCVGPAVRAQTARQAAQAPPAPDAARKLSRGRQWRLQSPA